MSVTKVMDVLSKIFGGKVRIRIMRMFLLNPEKIYQPKDVALLLSVGRGEVERELISLREAGFLKREFCPKEPAKKGRKKEIKLKGFILNRDFLYLRQLEGFLINTLSVKSQDLLKKVLTAGSIKLVVIAGIFVQDMDGRVDLLIVGDKISKGALNRILRYLESNIGKDLKYAVFETNDFNYRRGVGDHLIRDIFDFRHQVLLDKIGLKPAS